MDSWFDRSVVPPTRYELHYGGSRMVRCFTDRPKSVHEMLSNAVARRPHGVALIFGERLGYLFRTGSLWSAESPAASRRLASKKATGSPW